MATVFRTLLSPRWLLGHVVVLVVVTVCVSLGFWQLRRLEERRTFNARVSAQMSSPAVPLDQLLADVETPEAVEYRQVTITGRYLADEQLRLYPRTRDGRPGHHLLTPLQTTGGSVVLVDRGWVPFEQSVPADPPEGDVSVLGRVRDEPQRGRFGPRIPSQGRLEQVPRVEFERLAQQLPDPLAPVYVELSRQDPPQPGRYPRPVPPPELDEANHLSYAVQWFLFGLVGLVGYPLLIRRSLADERRAHVSTLNPASAVADAPPDPQPLRRS